MFRRLTYPTLELPPTQRRELAAFLVEFGEDVHCGIGMWRAVEEYNAQFFGIQLPFLTDPGDTLPEGVSRQRVQHLLWGAYGVLHPELAISPTHADLEVLAEMVAGFLSDRLASVPTDSVAARFLQTPNTFGWDVKRKLVWMGRHSYLFRMSFPAYVAAHGGTETIPVTDDFVCQETTLWSGLGAVDLLAATLDITQRQKRDLHGWCERHMAYYRVTSVHGPIVEAVNVINDKPYVVRVGEVHAPKFPAGTVFLGSLVPWDGEWYVSGGQQTWPSLPEETLRRMRADFLKRLPTVAYRYCEDLAAKAVQHTRRHYRGFVARHGSDLAVFPDGLAMAADWQRAGRELFEAAPTEDVERVMEKHGLRNPWPSVSIPDELLRCENGVGVFFHPDLGQEIMPGFDDVVTGMKKRGAGLTDDEKRVLRAAIADPVISPEFVKRLVREYGEDSLLAAFLLPKSCSYALDFLLRRHKGPHSRNRYPSLSFV